jgi:hypothetical protein
MAAAAAAAAAVVEMAAAACPAGAQHPWHSLGMNLYPPLFLHARQDPERGTQLRNFGAAGSLKI